MTIFINNKNKQKYVMIGAAIDCTNDRDGTRVVIYKKIDSPLTFVRESDEFFKKFTKENDENENEFVL